MRRGHHGGGWYIRQRVCRDADGDTFRQRDFDQRQLGIQLLLGSYCGVLGGGRACRGSCGALRRRSQCFGVGRLGFGRSVCQIHAAIFAVNCIPRVTTSHDMKKKQLMPVLT